MTKEEMKDKYGLVGPQHIETPEVVSVDDSLLRAYKTINHTTSVRDVVDFTRCTLPEYHNVPEEHWPYVDARDPKIGIIPGRVDVHCVYIPRRNRIWNRLMVDIISINLASGYEASQDAINFVRRGLDSIEAINGERFDSDALDRLGFALLDCCVTALDLITTKEEEVRRQIKDEVNFLGRWEQITNLSHVPNVINSVFYEFHASEDEKFGRSWNPDLWKEFIPRFRRCRKKISAFNVSTEVCNCLIRDLKVNTQIAIDALL